MFRALLLIRWWWCCGKNVWRIRKVFFFRVVVGMCSVDVWFLEALTAFTWTREEKTFNDYNPSYREIVINKSSGESHRKQQSQHRTERSTGNGPRTTTWLPRSLIPNEKLAIFVMASEWPIIILQSLFPPDFRVRFLRAGGALHFAPIGRTN